MDWFKIKNKIFTEIEFAFLYFIKYWKMAIFVVFFREVLGVIYIIFVGTFVQNLSNISDYLLIVVIGAIFADAFYEGFFNITKSISNTKSLAEYSVYSHSFFYFLRWFVSAFLYLLIEFFAFFLFFIILLQEFIPYIIFVFVFSLIILLFSSFVVFLFSPLLIYIRSEARHLIGIIENFLSIFVPIYFLLSYFFFYKYTLFNPVGVIIEELRNFLLHKNLNYNMLFFAILVSLIYFIFGLVLFRIFFALAKRRGWVRLL